MKCFIHIHDDAIAVCKRCGKAMCGNCSAYTNHSGICPECKREEFIQESARLSEQIKRFGKKMTRCFIIAGIIALLVMINAITVDIMGLIGLVFSVVFVIFAFVNRNRRKPLQKRLDFLTGEIRKLNAALSRSAAII